jgi:hypothetical protein
MSSMSASRRSCLYLIAGIELSFGMVKALAVPNPQREVNDIRAESRGKWSPARAGVKKLTVLLSIYERQSLSWLWRIDLV